MIIQKSNSQNTSTLYLVATPIGNLSDMTFRAIDILKTVDYIFAEDTRVTKVLLSHFNIETTLKSYHSFNEAIKAEEIINLLSEGKNIALVSDAGMPGISDPGYLIAKLAIENKYNVISIPGANAALTALVASGLPSEKFYFYGFLKHKSSQKEKELELLINYKDTIIFYESPHRIKETISIMYKVFKNRNIVIAREITKKFEEYIRGSLEELINFDYEYKGEIVIILEGAKEEQNIIELNNLTIIEHFNYYIDNGNDQKEAMKLVAKDRKISKSEVYKQLINEK